MAQGQLDGIGAGAKPVPITHPSGLLEKETLGGSQAGKPESSTSHGWDAALKISLGNGVVAAKPWLGHLLGRIPGLQKGSPGTPSRLEKHQPRPISTSHM